MRGTESGLHLSGGRSGCEANGCETYSAAAPAGGWVLGFGGFPRSQSTPTVNTLRQAVTFGKGHIRAEDRYTYYDPLQIA